MSPVRALTFVTVLTLLSACASRGGGEPAANGVHYLDVVTDPAGATLTLPDGRTCETPCTVGLLEPQEITIARFGYEALKATVTPNTRSPARIELTPVVRNDEIESFELPPLQ